MKRLDSKSFVHVSVRLPSELRDQLRIEAKRSHNNFNSLINDVLEKHVSFDRITEHVRAVPVNLYLFSEMLRNVPVEQMEAVGKELGPRLIRQTFTFLGIEYDLESLIQYYFEPVGAYSRWYSFNMAGRPPNRKLMFEHQYGRKWSAFLRYYVGGIIKSATGNEPRITVDDE